ncbi:MAG: hypothetical protein NZ659_11050 [Acidimicrobiales bacterium]|nr:hypothetical protein [Acidimicrobiales bacterium]
MSHRCFASLGGLVVMLLVSSPVAAQDGPRTAWGASDLQGVWDFRTITPLQRPEDLGDQEFLTAEEAANLEQEAVARDERLLLADARKTEAGGNVGAYNNFWMDRGTRTIGTRRTSLVIDPPNGRIPAMTAAGRARGAERRDYRREHPADSWLDRSTFDRCILGFNTGPPMTPGGYNQNMQVFQTEDHVVILNEMVHDSRIIPIDGSPRTGIGSWTGESRGHWEGDTLVIETQNFTDKTRWRGTTEDMTLVERLTRQDDATLVYTFTVTDEQTWETPWTAEIPMRRSDQPLYEYACHEGNYSMDGILSGARSDERAR